MDPIDSGGQNEPSEQSLYLSLSSRGRQRKKNPKFFDYEMDDAVLKKSANQESLRRRSAEEGATSQKSQRKVRKPKTDVGQPADEEKESTDKMPPDSVGETVAVTPKKQGRSKKTQSVPKETVTTDGNLPAGEAGESVAENSVQHENETPKPKRKYVRKKAVQVVEDPACEKGPTCEKDPDESPTEPEEQTGGRRRRKAAKVALKYLHILATEVLSHPSEEPGSQPSTNGEDVSEQEGPKQRKGRRRKHLDGEAAGDEDFVPDIEEEADEMGNESEEEEEEEVSDAESDLVELKRSRTSFHVNKHHTSSGGKHGNGLDFSTFKTVLDSAETTKKFREEHYSSWVFPEWAPSIKDWDLVAESNLEKYLPQERESAAFKVTREGLTKEETPQLRLSRFESVPAHSDRWDMFLFAGGPVWALEWCPTPDGAPATQYVALACHRGMDDVHCVNRTYTEPGLIQLWDCGKLEHNSSPDSQPALVYGLAQDKGFIWQLKWCPAGGWEPPSCGRKAPFLPRLGLLAVATSNSVVTIYSLPHPDALLSNRSLSSSEKDHQKPPIYKARGVMTLKLGSIKAPREERSGQVLSMDWLPHKPHNVMAVGFYDGVVGLWDLSTNSALLRVREPDRSLTLLPYRCIFAHDHAVRALAFCPASRHLLTTAGEDRYIKLWDLRRLFDPIRVQKRYLTNEICWLLDAPAVMNASDSAFVPRGSVGIHLFEHNMNSFFAVPRNASVWSMSYSEWLHIVMSADQLGEVILSMLPPMTCTIPHVRRQILRRFPAYFTSKMLLDEDRGEMRGAEDEGHVGDGHEGGETEKTGASSEGNEKNEAGGASKDTSRHVKFQTYEEATKKHFLHYTDFNMTNLAALEKRPLWKRMQGREEAVKEELDDMPLAALYKVRFNPNMSSHVWFASGGQVGLVRLHCLRTMITSRTKKMIVENQTQFNALYSQQDQREAVQTAAEHL